MPVISKAEILLRLQKLEQEARDLAILVENADLVDDVSEAAAVPAEVREGEAS